VIGSNLRMMRCTDTMANQGVTAANVNRVE
jgi:hypothetical protein